MGGQSAPHKRGGTHRVKDEDKTHSKFDEYKYQQLKDECIARKIYVKDMKKSEMARALVVNDREAKRAEREATKERVRKQNQMQREKAEENAQRQRAYAERQRRRRQKEEMRQREESVSDDTPDEEELQLMKEMFGDTSDHGDQGPVGQALSEESWESTSTETASSCTNPGILPDCKLRLFEWTYLEMPSPTARSGPKIFLDGSHGYWDDSKAALSTQTFPYDPDEDGDDEQTVMSLRTLPVSRNVPYAPVKVHTTESKEKVFLPGQTYPPGIDADYVPILSQRTRRAARNGILEGVLRCAAIEPATAWLSRTRLQGWNAYMFFTLPPANETKSLSDVYQKWVLENRRLLRVKPRGDALRGERTARHAQRHRNKGRKQAEVLEASTYRPTAICYLPAYLDFQVDSGLPEHAVQNEIHNLSHLFYIRFPGCDVPHYYFWTRTGEWADPTQPNPNWDPELADEAPRRSQWAGKHLPGQPDLFRQFPIRIRRAIDLSPPPTPLSQQDFIATISRIEHKLYNDGLKSTIYQYRTKWRDAGKSAAWEVFGRALPLLYPSGALPTTPPVHAKAEVSVASKIASIELGHAAETFQGDEPWTSKDDVWWDVVLVKGESSEIVHDHENAEQELDELNPRDLEALYRRTSVQMSYTPMEACEKWLEDVKPEYTPLSPDSMSDYREEWEAKVFDHGRGFSHVTCPFCMQDFGYLDIEEQVEHMYKHSSLPPFQDYIHHKTSTAVNVNNQIDHRLSTAVHVDVMDAYDAGAEANSEISSKLARTSPKKPRTRNCHHGVEQHSTSHLHLLNDPCNRKHTPFSYLDGCAEVVQPHEFASNQGKFNAMVNEPDSLYRRPSAPSAPTHKKRKKIVDRTYRFTASPSDSDTEFMTIQPTSARKCRKIADPTYRDVEGNISSDGDVVVRKKRGKRRRVEIRKRKGASDGDVPHVRMDAGLGDDGDGHGGTTVGGAGILDEDVMGMDVDGEVEEKGGQEDAVAAKMWCLVM